MTSKFNTKLKGYAKKEVEDHISALKSRYDATNQEYRNRIQELKQEITNLYIKIENHDKQASIVGNALIEAEKQAEEIISASKKRYVIESERLITVKNSWQEYMRKATTAMQKLDSTLNVEAYIYKIEKQLKQIMNSDLNIQDGRERTAPEKQFYSESKRLDELAEVFEQQKQLIDGNIYSPNNTRKNIKQIVKTNIHKEIEKSNLEQEKQKRNELKTYSKDSRTDEIEDQKSFEALLNKLRI